MRCAGSSQSSPTWAGRCSGAVNTPAGTTGSAEKSLAGSTIVAMVTAATFITAARCRQRDLPRGAFLGLLGRGFPFLGRQRLGGQALLVEHLGGFVERARLSHGHSARPRIGVVRPAARQQQGSESAGGTNRHAPYSAAAVAASAASAAASASA